MAVKKETYINTELDWAEEQLASWKAYVDANPIHELKDRKTARGEIDVVVATVEVQLKSIRDTMKEYLQLLDVVNKLREREEAKIEVRGKGKLGSQAEKFLKERP